MALTRCENERHFYDDSEHAECPQCIGSQATLRAGAAAMPGGTEMLQASGLAGHGSPPAGGTGIPSQLTPRFRPIAPLKEGGMGKIYLVEEAPLRRCVALKVMHARYAGSAEQLQQFVREAVITARLEHPHIIPVHEIGTLGNGQIYYTMRYIEGRPLSQLSSTVSLRERVRMLRDAASAVDFAHSQGLWHRDIKPSNILIGAWGDVYVIDWGLVSVIPGRTYELKAPALTATSGAPLLDDVFAPLQRVAMEEMFADDRVSLTHTGPTAGTPLYVSPESFFGDAEKLGVPSDVWAFGMMLFELLTGQLPFPGHRILASHAAAVITTDVPNPRDLNPKAPEDLCRLCREMLERDLACRLPSLGEMISRINRFLDPS